MILISSTQRAIFVSISCAVIAAGVAHLGLLLARDFIQPPQLHEYGIDPLIVYFRLGGFCLLIIASILFSCGRVWLSLITTLLPLVLFARWVWVFHERWHFALSLSPNLGTDDGLIPGNFTSFFLVRGGLLPWDLLALATLVGLTIWELVILVRRSQSL